MLFHWFSMVVLHVGSPTGAFPGSNEERLKRLKAEELQELEGAAAEAEAKEPEPKRRCKGKTETEVSIAREVDKDLDAAQVLGGEEENASARHAAREKKREVGV